MRFFDYILRTQVWSHLCSPRLGRTGWSRVVREVRRTESKGKGSSGRSFMSTPLTPGFLLDRLFLLPCQRVRQGLVG